VAPLPTVARPRADQRQARAASASDCARIEAWVAVAGAAAALQRPAVLSPLDLRGEVCYLAARCESPHRLEAQDTALSRREPEFESLWGRHLLGCMDLSSAARRSRFSHHHDRAGRAASARTQQRRRPHPPATPHRAPRSCARTPPIGFAWTRLPRRLAEGRREHHRGRGLAPLERRADCGRQQFAVELEAPREHQQVVEVLHPAVGQAKLHHRFHLLCHDRLARIGAQARRRKVEQRRELHLDRCRGDGVAEPDIDSASAAWPT
jgi:hypothetical protein